MPHIRAPHQNAGRGAAGCRRGGTTLRGETTPMMALLFLLFAIAIGLVWIQRRGLAMLLFAGSMVLSVVWYFHHATDSLALSF